jgi:hypothetical protein
VAETYERCEEDDNQSNVQHEPDPLRQRVRYRMRLGGYPFDERPHSERGSSAEERTNQRRDEPAAATMFPGLSERGNERN